MSFASIGLLASLFAINSIEFSFLEGVNKKVLNNILFFSMLTISSVSFVLSRCPHCKRFVSGLDDKCLRCELDRKVPD